MALSNLTVNGITPDLNILGSTQYFNFAAENNSVWLKLRSLYAPIQGVPSSLGVGFLNQQFNGFDFIHTTALGEQYGVFSFRKFTNNGQTVNNIFSVNSTQFLFGQEISMNSFKITGLANPTVSNDAVNLAYLQGNTVSSVAISGSTGLSVSGSPITSSGTISLTLSTQLQNLHSLNSLGFISLSNNVAGGSSFVNRSLTVSSNLTISNASGVAGNPLIDLASNITTNSFTTSGGDVNATTGTLKGNNLSPHNSTGINVTSLLGMNSNKITYLGTPTNTQDAATKSYVDTFTPTAQSILHGYVYTTYNTNIVAGDHIKFANAAFTRGSNISLDTSTAYNTSTNTASIGRITLAAGKTYKLIGVICTAAFSATNGYLGLKWYNSDNNTALGTVNTWWGSAWTYTSGGEVIAFITTTISTRVELRINATNNVSTIYGTSDSNSAPWFVVEEI